MFSHWQLLRHRIHTDVKYARTHAHLTVPHTPPSYTYVELLTLFSPSLPVGRWWARWFRQRAGHGGRWRPLWAAVGRLISAPHIQPSSHGYDRPRPGWPLRTRHPGQRGLHPVRVGPWLWPQQRSGEPWRARQWGEERGARGGGWVSEDGYHSPVRSVQLHYMTVLWVIDFMDICLWIFAENVLVTFYYTELKFKKNIWGGIKLQFCIITGKNSN